MSSSPLVGTLLHFPDVHPYKKWWGTHWRLVALADLGVPAGTEGLASGVEQELAWLASSKHRDGVPVIDGLARCHASQEGNALYACSVLGFASDPRVAGLAESLLEWQWPDGGWNCDPRASGRRSSFHESLAPAWGLHEHWLATGDERSREAALRTAELFLEHRVFRRLATGEPLSRAVVTLHWPPYWHYDVLQALVVLSRMGLAGDPRLTDALDVVRARRQTNGHWRASSRWWKPPPSTRAGEAVDWRRDEAGDRMVTLRAMSVLRRAAVSA